MSRRDRTDAIHCGSYVHDARDGKVYLNRFPSQNRIDSFRSGTIVGYILSANIETSLTVSVRFLIAHRFRSFARIFRT